MRQACALRARLHGSAARNKDLKARDCPQAKEPPPALQLSLYVRWTSPSGVSKVNRLLLRPVSSVEALQVQRPPSTVSSPSHITMTTRTLRAQPLRFQCVHALLDGCSGWLATSGPVANTWRVSYVLLLPAGSSPVSRALAAAGPEQTAFLAV